MSRRQMRMPREARDDVSRPLGLTRPEQGGCQMKEELLGNEVVMKVILLFSNNASFYKVAYLQFIIFEHR